MTGPEALERRHGLLRQRVEAVGPGRVRVGGRWLLNFASCHYLGLGLHPAVGRASAVVARRFGISLAMPRALATTSLSERLEAALSRLTGHQSALVFPSTTHAALDVLPALAGGRGTLLLDSLAYPISFQAAAVAAAAGARIRTFSHNDANSLESQLTSALPGGARIIVCDGVYPASGVPAPLGRFLDLARHHAAFLYVDDAHGLGVLGRGASPSRPYGSGGGGTPAHFGLSNSEIVHVGSLSKAFGVPLAFVAGRGDLVDRLRAAAPSITHSSPPSLPVLAAGLAALQVHSERGDLLRDMLLRRVRRFRSGLIDIAGFATANSSFPIQTLMFGSAAQASDVGCGLRRMGVWPVVQVAAPRQGRRGAVRFIVTVHHRVADLDHALCCISRVLRSHRHDM
jgi:8-amino-7-oxononanoate synthase